MVAEETHVVSRVWPVEAHPVQSKHAQAARQPIVEEHLDAAVLATAVTFANDGSSIGDPKLGATELAHVAVANRHHLLRQLPFEERARRQLHFVFIYSVRFLHSTDEGLGETTVWP
jgi:hypothetical protein